MNRMYARWSLRQLSPRALKYCLVFFVAGLFVLPASVVDAKRRRCMRKRWRCLKKCVRKSVRSEKKCLRRVNRRRGKCIRQAWLVGKKCIRKLTCEAADKCYQKCSNDASPIECHVKKGCAKIRSNCYKSCQYSPGERLKLCLNSTKQSLKMCSKRSIQKKEVCQAACPSCS